MKMKNVSHFQILVQNLKSGLADNLIKEFKNAQKKTDFF